MVRPKKTRFIGGNPIYKIFKPAGVRTDELGTVEMTLDEFEALRLVDFEQMDHLEASTLIGVSRPTLTRLIETARRKAADSIVNGKALFIDGGEVEFVTHKKCKRCGKTHPGHKLKQRKFKCCEGGIL
jgi:predicted DNA-binding protein (UPF0251 family)